MPTTTTERRTPNPADFARQLRAAEERRRLGESGVRFTSGDTTPVTIGDQLDEQEREALLDFKKQLIADVLSGTSEIETETTPVKSAEEAVAAFNGDRWGGTLFTTLAEEGFTTSILEFKPDRTIYPSSATDDEKKPQREIAIDNQLTYMVSVLRGEDGAIISAVAEPVVYTRGNATLVWRADSGIPLSAALDPTKGRHHSRTTGRCRAVNHTTNPDGSPDYAGHLGRIQARLTEPVAKFLREAK